MSRFGFSTTAEDIVTAFPGQIKGRTFAITGTSAEGLGAHAAAALARASPAHLILLSRTKSKVDPVIKEIKSIDPAVKVSFVSVSLDDQDSVRKAAKEIDSLTDHIDVLINNAGVMAIPEYTTNKDGIEMTLATNHIGHFLLTKLLSPKLITAATATTGNQAQTRIINLTSRGHQISPFLPDDPNFTQPQNSYDPWTSYGQSKTANILFTLRLTLSQTLQKHNIRSFAVHPGGIYTTGLSTHLTPADFEEIFAITKRNTGQEFGAAQHKTLAQGSSSSLWAALDPELDGVIAQPDNEDDPQKQGLYVNDCQFESCRAYARGLDAAKELWEWSEGVVGEEWEI